MLEAKTANRYINLYSWDSFQLICVHPSREYLLDEMLGAIMGAKLQGQKSADGIVIDRAVAYMGSDLSRSALGMWD